MKPWMLAGAACFCLASSAWAGPVNRLDDSSAAAALDWCDAAAQRIAHIQPAQELRAARAAIRAYAAKADPQAAGAQNRRLGLHAPAQIDPTRPLVVLLHGLDMDESTLSQMASLLVRDGQQVAIFAYPADGPIADDSDLLRTQVADLIAAHPALRLNLIAYSMGSLVARDYVEGPAYAGHVDHLILLAPPNHGSRWAHFEPLLKAKHDYDQYRGDPDFKASWIVTEGLCEAADDLLPHSSFLGELNARPRRAGVRYTIIDGDQHVLRRLAANALTETAGVIAHHTQDRPATLAIEFTLANLAADVAQHHDRSDGAVTLASAALPGVSDVVTVHADHGTLFWPDSQGNPPAAWPVIADRLSR